MKRVYLDNAAATPMHPEVLRAMQPYFTDVFYNPSATYEGARTAKSALEDARAGVAQSIGSRPSEVIFTSGGTESANMAIHGIMEQYPDGELLVSAIEHEAVLRPAQQYGVQLASVDKSGRVDIKKLVSQITDKTVLISVMLVNNEIGTVQPITEIAERIKIIKKQRIQEGNKLPIYLHTDACQAPLYVDVNVGRLGVDLMTLNAGKMNGPKQSGILFVKAGVALKPLILGGGQEFGLRSGTENVAFAVGFNTALKRAVKGRNERARGLSELRDLFMTELEDKLGAEIIGDRKHRVANNVHAKFDKTDNERVIFALDDSGIDVASGSACSASSETSSHVLLALGMTDDEARSCIRFTLGAETSEKDLRHAITVLKTALVA